MGYWTVSKTGKIFGGLMAGWLGKQVLDAKREVDESAERRDLAERIATSKRWLAEARQPGVTMESMFEKYGLVDASIEDLRLAARWFESQSV